MAKQDAKSDLNARWAALESKHPRNARLRWRCPPKIMDCIKDVVLTLPAEVQDHLFTQCTLFVMLVKGSSLLPIGITTVPREQGCVIVFASMRPGPLLRNVIAHEIAHVWQFRNLDLLPNQFCPQCEARVMLNEEWKLGTYHGEQRFELEADDLAKAWGYFGKDGGPYRCAFDHEVEKARGHPDRMAVLLAENEGELEEVMREAAERDPGDGPGVFDDVPDDPHEGDEEEF